MVRVAANDYILAGVAWHHHTLDGGEHPVHLWTNASASTRPALLCNGRTAWLQTARHEFGDTRELARDDQAPVLAMNAASARWTAVVPNGGQRTVTVLLAALADDREQFLDLALRPVRDAIVTQAEATDFDMGTWTYRVERIGRYLVAAFAAMTEVQRDTFHVVVRDLPVLQAAEVALHLGSPATP
jgi:hypothetical protein